MKVLDWSSCTKTSLDTHKKAKRNQGAFISLGSGSGGGAPRPLVKYLVAPSRKEKSAPLIGQNSLVRPLTLYFRCPLQNLDPLAQNLDPPLILLAYLLHLFLN